MQTARIPLAVLIALEMASFACTPHSVQPCLNVAAPEDDADLGPCLEVVEPPDPEPEPKSEPEPEPTTGNEPGGEGVEMRPCLDVIADPPPELTVPETASTAPRPRLDTRADVIARLAGVLPPDVVAKLRNDG